VFRRAGPAGVDGGDDLRHLRVEIRAKDVRRDGDRRSCKWTSEKTWNVGPICRPGKWRAKKEE